MSGMALQQIAGFVRPTKRDLGNLPERAFAEMGLEPIDKDQAVAFLMEHGMPSTSNVTATLLGAFPRLRERWKGHVAFWGGQPAGSYNDMAEVVHFVVEDLYEKGNLAETRRVFELLGKLFEEGDVESKNLIALGFFETLQCFASWRPYGNKAFEQFLSPTSMEVWREIQRQWVGKSSLMDVLRAEREHR
ncbi:MAG TPA: hypothetical protein VMT20_02980 [Terriglobia bacterium]|nr:hypothetical protein [Terriglobia bacterium]